MDSTWVRLLVRGAGIFILLAPVSCAGIESLPAAFEPEVAAPSLPVVPNRVPAESLPEICNCILRFDSLGIEEGLSQSSVRVIFQDRRGFLWFGTEDGLNLYDGYSFKVFKPEPNNPNSISSGWITAITEDQDGYLWVGTDLSGLNRYDPASGKFTQYQYDEQNLNGLVDNHIKSLLVDDENQLWVGTINGLDRLESTSGIFHHYPALDPANQNDPYSLVQDGQLDASLINSYPGISTLSYKLSSAYITAIHQDSRGSLWIGTLDGGINVFDPQENIFTIFRNIPDEPSTVSSNRITAITEDPQGGFWIGTNTGLNHFNSVTGKFKRYVNDSNPPLNLSDNTINALWMDGIGNLWIGTPNGLDRLDRDRTRFIHYQNDPSFPRSLSGNFILAIFEDRGGVLWFGTQGGGVNLYDREVDKFAYYRHDATDPNSLSGNSISPVLVDREGFAWIGIPGAGLNRFHWQSGEITRYINDAENPNSLGSNWVTSMLEENNGTLWIGTNNGLDRFVPLQKRFSHYRRDPSNPDSISANLIYTIFEDSQEQLWVGTFSGLDRLDKTTGIFTHFRPNADDPTSLSGNKPLAILEDREGYLWVGTAENGLNRMDPQTNKFTHYNHDPKDQNSLSSDSILSIHQDSKGRLWIGTAGSGLNLYHPETDSFTHYVEKDGLPNGYIYGILEDDWGRLWMSTNFGIARFDPDLETVRNYDSGDGLQGNEFNSGAYAKGRDGEFYFGGVNGLTVFHPLEITDSQYLPQVVLTTLKQEDQALEIDSGVETLQSVTLAWPQNSFEFEFAALSYKQPEKNLYAYTLEGFDTNWHYIGTQRGGRYTNLPGGNYILLLKAANSDGVWNETPTRVSITIIPPYWQTTWFRLLLGLAAVTAILSGVRLRTKTIQDRNRQLERLVRERTSALEKRNQEIQALYLADERILRNVSLQQVFQTLVDVAVDTLDADRSLVFAWDEKLSRLVPRVSRGFSAETLKVLALQKGEGAVGNVLKTGEPVIIRQIQLNDFPSELRDALIAEGIRSFVNLPITVDHKIVGVFNVGFTKPNLIGDDTTRLFSALSQRASLSIANMELFEQTKDLAVMEERNRLARDLHDSAKQKAFAALAQLGTARSTMNGNGNNAASLHLNEAENLVSDVIQELTFLVQEIYPIALQEKGLARALRDYIYEWENRNDIAVQLVNRNDRRLSLEVEQALYRVAQEALANVARHSRARSMEISLVYNIDSVQLSLADDGCGFDTNIKSYGMGLRSIRERVSSIHGTVQIQSAPGHGTRIVVQVPIKG